jgi:hypothetical protein
MFIDIQTLRKYSLQFGHSEALVIAELSLGPATKEELASRMGRSTRTIQSYLKPLIQFGIILKNTVSHEWYLSDSVLKNEIVLNEKKISINKHTNIHTDISNNNSNLFKTKQVPSKAENTNTHEETFCNSEKQSSQEPSNTIVTSSDHFKGARLACMIMFGSPIDTLVNDLASLLSEFQTIDMKLVASAAHVVRKGVRTNPVMMFIATYRNKVKAHQLLTLIKSQPDQKEPGNENSNKKVMDNKKSVNQRGFVGGQTGGKYDVFYKLYQSESENSEKIG